MLKVDNMDPNKISQFPNISDSLEINPKAETVDAAIEFLTGVFKKVETKYDRAGQIYLELSCKDDQEADLISVCLEILNILPWQDGNLITIENRYDIKALEECGILTAVKDLTGTTSEINGVMSFPKIEMQPIPEIFGKREKVNDIQEIDSDTEVFLEENDKSDINNHPQSSGVGYLYRISQRKYKWDKRKLLNAKTSQEISEEEYNNTLNLAKQKTPEGEKARSEFLLMNMGLVYFIALNFRKVFGDAVDMQDLLQEGLIAMNKCIDNYDMNEGTKFSSYVIKSMKFHLFTFFHNNKNIIHVPHNVQNKLRLNLKAERVVRSMAEFHESELYLKAAKRLGIPYADFMKVYEDALYFYNYEDIEEIIEDPQFSVDSLDPYHILLSKENKDLLRAIFDKIYRAELARGRGSDADLLRDIFENNILSGNMTYNQIAITNHVSSAKASNAGRDLILKMMRRLIG